MVHPYLARIVKCHSLQCMRIIHDGLLGKGKSCTGYSSIKVTWLVEKQESKFATLSVTSGSLRFNVFLGFNDRIEWEGTAGGIERKLQKYKWPVALMFGNLGNEYKLINVL